MSPRKICVTITYTHPGTVPPVYVAGSFSEPAWNLQEMDYTAEENNEHRFYKKFMADEGGQFQYKFRIGSGDWWVLDENAPTVNDDAGNRNNLLSVPNSDENVTEAFTLDPPDPRPKSNAPIPEVVVENMEAEAQPGNRQGVVPVSQQVYGTNGGTDKGIEGDLLGYLRDMPETNTPVYARTAAEVADSAEILDREPSPTPVPDAEAGRTGERRLSATPISEVAKTAADVADSAAIIGKEDMKLEIPQYEQPLCAHSGLVTPFQEQIPLFAHECVGPYEGEEQPSGYESQEDRHESPVYNGQEDAMIDTDDPLLEDFPQDRLSILAHVRSTESRLSEDETNFEAIPASPISRTKSPSPIPERSPSTQPNARSSPSLEIIVEERQEQGFVTLPRPSSITKSRQSSDMSDKRRPDIGTITENEPRAETGVLHDADLADLNQDQSAFHSVSVARDDVQDGSTESATSITSLLEAEDEEFVEQTLLITTVSEAVDTESTGQAPIPKADGMELKQQEHLIASISETANSELIKQDLSANINPKASGNKLTEQELSDPGIGQRGLKERVDSITAPLITMGNETIDELSFIAALPQNTETELGQKLCSIFSIPGTAKDKPADDSAKLRPSGHGDRDSSGGAKESSFKSTAQHSRGIGTDPATPALVKEIVETAKDRLKGDLLGPAGLGSVGRDMNRKDEPGPDSAANFTETIRDHITIQTLLIDKLPETTKNDPIVDTPTPVAPIPSAFNSDNGEALIIDRGDGGNDDERSTPAHLATPESGAPEAIEVMAIKGVDVTKSTALEEPSSNGDSKVKMRNPTYAAERSGTPASLRPPGRDKETRNFLQVLWRTVFIQWIGGFFAQLCGGRRRP